MFANSDDDYEITFLLSFPLQIPILILLLVSGGHIVEMDAVDHVDLSTKSTIVKHARVRAFQEAAMDNESCDKSATDIECRKKSAADTESIEKSTMDTEGIEDTGVNVKSRLEAAMYVKGSEEAAMEDFINTKDSPPHPPLLCTRHLLRLTSSTTVTPFTMSMSEFERIPNFRTNRVPNMYSKMKSVRIEYRVITRSGKTIRIVFKYQKRIVRKNK